MNRFVKFAAASLLVASAAFAQEAGAPKFGAYLGAGMAGFNGDDADDIDAGLGFAVGGALVMPLYPKIDINANVLFSMRMPGSETTETEEGDSYTVERNFNEMSIDVPVMARFKMDKVFLQAGPQLGFNVSSEYEVSSGDFSMTMKNKDRATLEAGLTAGAGYQVTDKVSVDLRYFYSFTSIGDQTTEDEEGNESSVEIKVNPYYAMIGATYMF